MYNIPQSMMSGTPMPLSDSDSGVIFNPEIYNERVRKKPKQLDDNDKKISSICIF